MKKSKMSKLAIAAIASLAIATSGTFAWFVARTTSGSADVNTARIQIGNTTLKTVDAANKLPGEKVILNDGAGVDNKIENTSTRDAIFKISFTEATKGLITDTNRKALLNSAAPALKSDYVASGSDFAMTPARLTKVAEMRMDNTGADKWVEVTNATGGVDYYLKVTPGNDVTVNEMSLTLLPELGGNVKIGPNNWSPDRSFEQECKFTTAYTITAVQASKQAIADNYGDDVVTAIQGEHADTWFMFN